MEILWLCLIVLGAATQRRVRMGGEELLRFALVIILALLVGATQAQQIERSRAEVRAFRTENPCPSTGVRRGPCAGYQVDHADPICAGGSDTADNMQWLTTQEHKWKTRSDVRMCRLNRAPKRQEDK